MNKKDYSKTRLSEPEKILRIVTYLIDNRERYPKGVTIHHLTRYAFRPSLGYTDQRDADIKKIVLKLVEVGYVKQRVGRLTRYKIDDEFAVRDRDMIKFAQDFLDRLRKITV